MSKFIAPIESANQDIIFYKNPTTEIPTTINLPANETPLTFIHRHINNNRILVLQAETGSGKTTRLPIEFINDPAFTKIYATQPRVFNVTKNVEILRSIAGDPDLVGFKTGPLTELNKKNKVIMLTEGTLLLDILSNPAQFKNCLLILDEVHERTLDLDLIMSIVKSKYKSLNLKIIITSATLETKKLATYFNNASIAFVAGTKPNLAPTIFLSQNSPDYVQTIFETIVKIHTENPPNNSRWRDILVFLPTRFVISQLHFQLTQSDNPALKDLLPTRLYRNISAEEQTQSIAPLSTVSQTHTRRVILATNVAETGINFNELKYVIDSGWSNTNFYDPYTNSTALILSNITKNQAIQRWGRAGRDQSSPLESQGIVYAIYTENTYTDKFPQDQLAQIYKQPIDKFMLLFLSSESTKLSSLIDQPSAESVSRALSNLFYYGMVKYSKKFPILTPFATQLASKLKIQPKYSRMLLASINYRCTIPMITIISMLTFGTESLFLPNQNLLVPLNNSYFSDHVNLYLTYQYYTQNINNPSHLESIGINTSAFETLTLEINDLTNTFSSLNFPLFNLDPDTYTEAQLADAIVYSITAGAFNQSATLSTKTFYQDDQNPSVIGKVVRSYAFNNSNKNLVKFYPKKIIYDQLVITKTFSGALEYKFSLATAVNDRVLSNYLG